MKKALAALLLASALLASCGSEPTSSSLPESEVSTSSIAERAPLETVLGLFDHSGTNNVTFSSIASSLETSSGAAPSYSTPTMMVTYDETGFLIEPDLNTGWPESFSGSFGLVELSSDNTAGVAPGVYETTVTTEEVADEGGNGTVNREVVTLGSLTSYESPYDVWTPQYLADHASELAAEFGRGVSSNVSTTYDQDTIEAVAKSLSIDGVARAAFPNIVYTRVDVTYTRSSVNYIFDVYGYPNGTPADSSSLGDGYRIARAILYPRDIEIEAYASLFPSEESGSSASNSEVAA